MGTSSHKAPKMFIFDILGFWMPWKKASVITIPYLPNVFFFFESKYGSAASCKFWCTFPKPKECV